MNQVATVERVLNDAYAMIESASDADLTKQTPCDQWDVRALAEHMTGVVNNFGTAFGGGQLTPPSAPGTGTATGAELSAAYRQAVDALLATVRAPGALDKTIKLPFGEMPGGQALGIVIGDQSIHTWDMAKALGRPYTMDEGVASSVLEMMHRLIGANPQARGGGFAAEVPCAETAPVQERLLAFSGRQP